MSVRVTCPGCGGSVVFEVGSSMVAVCPYCRSAVARGDRDIEDLGKVAALVDTGAILRIGLSGKYRGVGFRLTGRVQLGHEAGGVWDEWYAAFDDNRWGWLSEAQGRFYMLFEEPANDDRPPFESLQAGQTVAFDSGRHAFTIAEIGLATAMGAQGEIPYRFVPGSTYDYADLSGPELAFATLDYSQSQPTFFNGEEVSLEELGLPLSLRRESFELREVAARKIDCPNCGGSLELRAPDKTERVGCPYCGSILDTTQGNVKLLEALKEPTFRIHIPLGAKGKLHGKERTVIGAFRRSVTAEGIEYPWTEYLLYHPIVGFEWLVESNGHWSHVVPLPVDSVKGGERIATYGDKSFRKFQVGTAHVNGVVGECYWKVQLGEAAETADYVKPPEMLSREHSTRGRSSEVNWSLCTYTLPSEVQAAFGLTEPLPTPQGVAPNQPFHDGGIYKLAAIFLGVLTFLGLFFLIAFPVRKVHEQSFTLRAGQMSNVFHTDPLFDLTSNRNICVSANDSTLDGGLTIEGDLVRQETGESQPFVMDFGYYSGVEDGEAWSEGSRHDSEYVGAQPAGKYSLRLEVVREKALRDETLTVRVDQGSLHFKNWLLTFLGIAVLPLIISIRHLIFVQRRWANSDFPLFESSGDD